MANRTLLNEAIAEAESIRDAALANAKAALEESFAPHIKEMFSKKVQDMESKEDKQIEEMKEKDDKKEELEEMDAPSFDRKSGSSITPDPKKVGKTTVQEEEEIELDALLSQLDEEMDSDEDKIEEVKEEKSEEAIDESVEESEEIVKEEEGDIEMDVETSEEGEVSIDDPEVDLEEMTEDQLMDLIRDVIDELEDKGEIESAGGDAEAEEMDTESEDIEIETEEEPVMESSEVEEELTEEKKEDDDKAMEEALAEINKLKVDLQEVNLLNAKLLYSNKIFRSKNLSESKKIKVLESFDKANTAKEAKLIFDTLNEGIQTNEKRRPMREVKGLASRATKVIKENKQPIVESTDMVARFQKLAGIN
jgi:hypothetical protein|tara:strand:+ start:2561 stop:3655 length:1095 start_codon:yes stop_codon:yes gene_type:complete